MEKFNKREFAKFINKRLGLPQQEGQRLFDAIGEEISRTLESGGTAYAFGIGTLKVVRSQSEDKRRRVRLRVHPDTEAMLVRMDKKDVPSERENSRQPPEDDLEADG